MAECFGRFTLVRWLLEELGPDRARSIAAHVEHCERCRRKVEDIKANMEEFDAVGAERLHEVQRGFRDTRSAFERRRGVGRVARYTAAAAAAAVLLVSLYIALDERPRRGTQERGTSLGTIQYKGEFAAEIIVKRGARQFRAEAGDSLFAGDVLRFVVTASDAGYLTIVSLDARGNLTPFYPFSPPAADPRPYRIGSAGRHELPDAIELDDSPGEEEISILFSPHPFDRREMHETIKEIARREPRGKAYSETRLESGLLKILRFRKGDTLQ